MYLASRKGRENLSIFNFPIIFLIRLIEWGIEGFGPPESSAPRLLLNYATSQLNKKWSPKINLIMKFKLIFWYFFIFIQFGPMYFVNFSRNSVLWERNFGFQNNYIWTDWIIIAENFNSIIILEFNYTRRFGRFGTYLSQLQHSSCWSERTGCFSLVSFSLAWEPQRKATE
jgi:hypothetical protein